MHIIPESEICQTRIARPEFNDLCRKPDGEVEKGSKILNVNIYGLHSHRTDFPRLPTSARTDSARRVFSNGTTEAAGFECLVDICRGVVLSLPAKTFCRRIKAAL